jgi:hypothetical protein
VVSGERQLTRDEEEAMRKRLKRLVLKQPDMARPCARCRRPAKVYMAQVPAAEASTAMREGRVEPDEAARVMQSAKAYCAACYVAAVFRRA